MIFFLYVIALAGPCIADFTTSTIVHMSTECRFNFRANIVKEAAGANLTPQTDLSVLSTNGALQTGFLSYLGTLKCAPNAPGFTESTLISIPTTTSGIAAWQVKTAYTWKWQCDIDSCATVTSYLSESDLFMTWGTSGGHTDVPVPSTVVKPYTYINATGCTEIPTSTETKIFPEPTPCDCFWAFGSEDKLSCYIQDDGRCVLHIKDDMESNVLRDYSYQCPNSNPDSCNVCAQVRSDYYPQYHSASTGTATSTATAADPKATTYFIATKTEKMAPSLCSGRAVCGVQYDYMRDCDTVVQSSWLSAQPTIQGQAPVIPDHVCGEAGFPILGCYDTTPSYGSALMTYYTQPKETSRCWNGYRSWTVTTTSICTANDCPTPSPESTYTSESIPDICSTG